MIFDCHLHINTVGPKETEIEIQKLLEDMKLVGIDRTCVMSLPLASLYFSKKDTLVIAEVLDNIGQKYKDILYPLIWLNPTLPNDFLIEVLDKYILKGNIIGVKLWVELNARDTRLDTLAEYMQAHDIPLLFHSWYKTVGKYADESNPSDIASLARRFPSLRIIAAHLTGFKERGVQDIKSCPNVVIDTSGCQPENGIMEYALRELGADRILYGSDYAGRDFATQLSRIYSIKMSDSDREKILFKNALKFFRKGE